MARQMTEKQNLTKKAINFDLDTNMLKKYYPNKNYEQAYYDIRRFLENNNFKHRQGSGYISKIPMSIMEVTVITQELSIKYKWLKKCVKEIDVTEIGNILSLKETINIPDENDNDIKQDIDNQNNQSAKTNIEDEIER